MTSLPRTEITADIRQRAARIRLACFDVDGTLTDGRLYYDNEGGESKSFHIHDGQGLVLLRKVGIAVALITARNSPAAERRGAELGAEVFTGAKDKLSRVRELCGQHGLGLEQVAFMGDDLPDLACLRAAGLAVAPANAHRWIADQVHWITPSHGGQGAARELCDLLLDTQGHTDALLAGEAR